MVIILLFLGCGLDRAGRGSWELPRSSSSTAEASRLRQTTVETKFDLPWLCLSGLGSLHDFSGFGVGHGVI